MNSKKATLLCIFSAFAIFGNGCALPYVKIMFKADSVEGKIVLAREPYKKAAALYIVKDKELCQIPNTEMSGKIESLHWSPEGDRIAFWGYNGNEPEERAKTQGIYVINENGNNLKLSQKGILYPFNFSLDGKQIIYRDYSLKRKKEEFYIFTLDGSGLRRLTDEEVNNQNQTSRWPSHLEVRFSPDGKKKLWYKISSEQAPPNELYMTDLGTGEITLIAKGSYQVDIKNAVWSSDSKRIMYLRESIFDNQQIKVYDLEAKETIILMKFGGRYIAGFDWWTPSVK